MDTLVDLIKDTVRLRVMSLSLNYSTKVSEAANLWNFHVDRGMGRKKDCFYGVIEICVWYFAPGIFHLQVFLVLWDSGVMVYVCNVKSLDDWIALSSFVIGLWAMCDPSILMASLLVLSCAMLYMYVVVSICDYKYGSGHFEKLEHSTVVKMKTHCLVCLIICRFL
ncbi:hypothetical protein Tco_1493314 [Tanacetum coccineum]